MAPRPPTSDEHPDLQTVLTSLTDEDCRRILSVLSEPMSAREIGAACDIPLSTTYRKLNALSEASLVADQVDVSDGGNHTTKYLADFDSVTVELNDDGQIEVAVESAVADSDRLLSPQTREATQKS